MTPLLCVTTVFGLGAICNLFDSQRRAVTEQNILNVHICYPDTIDQGQLEATDSTFRAAVNSCWVMSVHPTQHHSLLAFAGGTASALVICAYLWSKVGPVREAIWFVVRVWCICEGTDAKSSTPGIQRQKPWQSNLLYNTIYAWGFVGMKSLQKKPALI